jgi:hypothetical protein
MVELPVSFRSAVCRPLPIIARDNFKRRASLPKYIQLKFELALEEGMHAYDVGANHTVSLAPAPIHTSSSLSVYRTALHYNRVATEMQ